MTPKSRFYISPHTNTPGARFHLLLFHGPERFISRRGRPEVIWSDIGSDFIEVFVRHYYELSGHSGQEHVLACIKEHNWIIRGRSTMKEVLHRCFVCKRQSSLMPMVQRMSSLHQERVTPDQCSHPPQKKTPSKWDWWPHDLCCGTIQDFLAYLIKQVQNVHGGAWRCYEKKVMNICMLAIVRMLMT